jgi:hypothetical protein
VPHEDERIYNWELHAQLTAHKAIEDLRAEETRLRDALLSLRSLFELARIILRDYGPIIALKNVEGDLSLRQIAIIMRNVILRDTLAKWHSLLLSHDNRRIASVLLLNREQRLDEHEDLR